ncbi:ESX secretion-associated protein EspG [Actinophytocola sp.]|uniref:ESX secretion-associated protein EspG n=1 Tax=Actinophytocola sp. TaxID=1872138 RepID=UPI002ED2BF2A
MLTDNLTLNLTTVHTLIRWRQAEPHPILATAPTWYDEDTKRALDRHALNELEENRRLRRGRPDSDLDDTIGALVRPDREHYGWITTTVEGRPYRYGVLAVAAYQEAVLVIRNYETDSAVLATIRPRELTSTFLAQLPALGAAAGQPVSTPYQDFLAATEPTEDGFAGFGTRLSQEVREINAVLSQPRTGGGSLYVAGRAGHLGTRRRGKQPINYLDTTSGRWLTQLDSTARGMVATLRPASTDLIATQLVQTERQLHRSE